MKSQRSRKNLSMRGLWWLGKKLSNQVIHITSDENFLYLLKKVEGIVSKILALGMLLVILVAIWNLGDAIISTLFVKNDDYFGKTLFKIFGMFLDVLIALEILENLTAYLKKPVIQSELVIVTSLIAVARKIIILDLDKAGGFDLIGLSLAIFALSISYWIIRRLNVKQNSE